MTFKVEVEKEQDGRWIAEVVELPGPLYHGVVTRDIGISVGGLFTGWNPLAHSEYWTDNDFTRPVAAVLHSIWTESQP